MAAPSVVTGLERYQAALQGEMDSLSATVDVQPMQIYVAENLISKVVKRGANGLQFSPSFLGMLTASELRFGMAYSLVQSRDPIMTRMSSRTKVACAILILVQYFYRCFATLLAQDHRLFDTIFTLGWNLITIGFLFVSVRLWRKTSINAAKTALEATGDRYAAVQYLRKLYGSYQGIPLQRFYRKIINSVSGPETPVPPEHSQP